MASQHLESLQFFQSADIVCEMPLPLEGAAPVLPVVSSLLLEVVVSIFIHFSLLEGLLHF